MIVCQLDNKGREAARRYTKGMTIEILLPGACFPWPPGQALGESLTESSSLQQRGQAARARDAALETRGRAQVSFVDA
jgi:hypothetical protein